ncbi:CoA ester lyase [Rhodanobacter sp. Si-c]|uniref:CoA ester lyase n=1 Tax=Rhodanobacter lycopersici TaxID=3162487 RepID=A0ABV3QEN1_9GAMM
MRLRSLLFVPGDRPERMAKAMHSAADAVILDLEDSVAPTRKPAAREAVAAFLANGARAKPVFVRINTLSDGMAEADLAALGSCAPDALVLPKAEGRASIEWLDELLSNTQLDRLPLLPIATETPTAVFALGSYRDIASRLLALTWGAEDLSAAIGATATREAGGFTAPYQIVRTLALFGAHAAGVPAIETVYTDIKDCDGLASAAARAARDGFAGMLAIHPSQLDVINAAFDPSEAELARARAIVAAFAEHPEAGALALEGQMIDAPHAKLAHRLIERAGQR